MVHEKKNKLISFRLLFLKLTQKNMKKNFQMLAIALFGVVNMLNAQAQDQECATNLSIYSEFVKVQNFDSAYAPWKMVYEVCPGLNPANFVYGERILRDKIEKSTGEEKTAFVNELLSLYQKYGEFFPSREHLAEVLIDQALLKNDVKMSSTEEIFNMLDKAFNEDRDHFTNSKALYVYFSYLVDLNTSGVKDLDAVFNTYDLVGAKIEAEIEVLNDMVTELQAKEDNGTLSSRDKRQLSIAESKSETFVKIMESIDSKLGGLANCENLIPLYQKNFEEKKSDIKWIKSAVSRMYNKECTSEPLFVKLVEAQNALDPTSDTYFYLGLLKNDARNSQGAVADFNKAVSLETDAKKRGNILYKIATIYKKANNKSLARSYALKALDSNAALGRAHLLIAGLYADSANECGATSFEKRAVYWKAAEEAKKAARVDLSLRTRANQMIERYMALAPSKTDIFSSGLAGKTVTFNCWLGGSISVPNL